MNWIYFPKTEEVPKHLKKVVAAFEKNPFLFFIKEL